MEIKIYEDKIESKLIDVDFNEEYILVDNLKEDKGFVALVNKKYQKIIDEIISYCFINLKTQRERIILKIERIYNKNPEYLWNKSPLNAIIRRNDNKKCFVLFMEIKAKSLGIDEDKTISVMNLRGETAFISSLDK